jgi:hypothetical protein
MSDGSVTDSGGESCDECFAFLSVDDVERAIKCAFDGEHEQHWAREAWAMLIEAGLAAHCNDLERCAASINFIAFAEFYKDWKHIGMEGSRDNSYGGLLEALGITPLRVGQLIGRHSDFLDDPPYDWHLRKPEERLLDDAICQLEMAAREEVVNALYEAYGSVGDLFVALWNSDKQPRPPDYEEKREEYEEDRAFKIGELNIWVPAYQESDDEILDDLTDEKMERYAWLDQGAEPLDRF